MGVLFVCVYIFCFDNFLLKMPCVITLRLCLLSHLEVLQGCVALYSFKHLTRLFWVVPSSVLLTLQSASFLITISGAHPFFHFYFFFGLTFGFILADYVTCAAF